ncbi:MAG: hypothetical protein VXV96_17670 [Bdellovibrionota bacterium]|nr:hypothetical protein [Bdellovibrionota bacterium]
MGLKATRKAVIEKLKEGTIQHELDRKGRIDEKNFLAVGRVSVDEVIEFLQATKGDEYEESDHHSVKDVTVSEFKPYGGGWYIKCYLIEPDVWFISVHK